VAGVLGISMPNIAAGASPAAASVALAVIVALITFAGLFLVVVQIFFPLWIIISGEPRHLILRRVAPLFAVWEDYPVSELEALVLIDDERNAGGPPWLAVRLRNGGSRRLFRLAQDEDASRIVSRIAELTGLEDPQGRG